MTDQFFVQYVGFTSGALAREYSFVVRRPSGELREYIVAIGNEAFVSHRARYQDGPDICSLRLHRELISNGDSSPIVSLCVTDSELVDYRNDHTPKPVKRFQPPKIEG
jgi:hypothetical protein